MRNILSFEQVYASRYWNGHQEVMLRDLSLTVKEGEIIVVFGPNGSGKSMAMKAAAGLLRISEGSIVLADQDITNISPHMAVASGLGYVPQREKIFANLTVGENLEIGAYFRGRDITSRLHEIYNLLPDLYEKRQHSARSISVMDMQMVAIGRVLMTKPHILLLDEPSAGLSSESRSKIFQIILDINASGLPILLVEQNAKHALAIADRGYLLVEGANSHAGAALDLLADREVAQLFPGKTHLQD